MKETIQLLASFWGSIIGVFNNTILSYGNIEISFGALIFVPLVVGMVITIFWKGSRS